jgi:hypothetical protein
VDIDTCKDTEEGILHTIADTHLTEIAVLQHTVVNALS